MEGIIRVERLYSLGDYKNIKFYTEVSNLPQEIVLDQDSRSKLYLLLMAMCDLNYYVYTDLYRKHRELSLKDAVSFLETFISDISNELKLKFENGKLE